MGWPSAKESAILDLLAVNDEMYGLQMVEASASLKRGTIYVTLGRMVDKGWIKSRQMRSKHLAGLPRRLYSRTAMGARVHTAIAAASMALQTR